ncbi:diguanylate cyclase domain-containing protein [Actinoplanes sp. NPDC004185]
MVRKLAVCFAVFLSVALVGSVGYYLAETVEASRVKILDEFGLRPRDGANAIAGTLGASDSKTRAVGVTAFSGTPAQLRRDSGKLLEQLGTPWYAVLEADGTELASYPPSHEAVARRLPDGSGLRIAKQTGRLAFGEVVTTPSGASVPAFQPFAAPGGIRVLVAPVAVEELSALFSSTLNLPSVSSYLIDGAGRVITSTGSARPATEAPEAALLSALRKQNEGVVGDTYFSAAPVTGTAWRVVMTTSKSALLAPVQSTGRVAWQIFGAFSLAMIMILLIGAVALLSSARLARSRLHDALTGLPNRALFMERAENAVLDWRRRRQTGADGALAALFLDLDGFKPVNDTYGHAVGDELLKQVALRLVDATRPDDYVGRFGGDEFVVLCRGVRTADDAGAVADRISAYLADPFVIGDRTITIGVSIGIATLDDQHQEAAALLHHADLALYRAKGNGRGRVEQFTPDMADQRP